MISPPFAVRLESGVRIVMKFLKKRRIELGITQKQIATICEIKQGYYSQIENGIRKPSVKLAKKLANLLKLDWTEFFN